MTNPTCMHSASRLPVVEVPAVYPMKDSRLDGFTLSLREIFRFLLDLFPSDAEVEKTASGKEMIEGRG